METAELVKTSETTNDGELTLYYELRPDPGASTDFRFPKEAVT